MHVEPGNIGHTCGIDIEIQHQYRGKIGTDSSCRLANGDQGNEGVCSAEGAGGMWPRVKSMRVLRCEAKLS